MSSIFRNIKRISILFIIAAAHILICVGCNNHKKEDNPNVKSDWKDLKKTDSLDLKYADQFSVDNYENGYRLITIAKQDKYLLVPEGKKAPQGVDEDIKIINLPIKNVYLAASSVMDIFRELDALDIIKMTGTKPEDWSIKSIQDMVSNGEIEYAGKYSTPDYEMIVDNNCDLVLESTMIYHSPEVKEQFEKMGITTWVDYSSYESTPLGRVEWIRLYGILSGKEQKAEEFMKDCMDKYDSVTNMVKENDKKTVAFFYINSQGNAIVRKPGDYISKMIDIAGGKYVFSDVLKEKENEMSTMNMQMETFYETAVDADILIYNSTIDGEIESVDQLIQKNSLLADFKAVKEGNVWCTSKNMYQEVTGTIEMIENFYSVFNGNEQDTIYIHKLQ